MAKSRTQEKSNNPSRHKHSYKLAASEVVTASYRKQEASLLLRTAPTIDS